jgi:carboxyl-terminal processing protease
LHIGLLRYYAETGNASYPVLQRAHLSWPPEVVKPEKTVFRGKLLLLADGRCASACEDFLVPFKDNGRGVLLGERTEGSSGQPYTANLGDDVTIGIGTKREYFPGGGQFEGVGIAPDIEVKLRADDLRAGRDPVLARALELARAGKP